MSPDRASPETVMARYAELINRHDFSLLVPLIHPQASFWFSSGTHAGINAARAAFESTWHRLAEESYWLEDLSWIAIGETAASCTYSFHWRAVVEGHPAQGTGRGTTVLTRDDQGWRIVHEHLSPFPQSAQTRVEKVCPVVIRHGTSGLEVLAFRHPLAGKQIVKGTLEAGETIEAGALRELAEESGLVGAIGSEPRWTSSQIAPDQPWHFVPVMVGHCPDLFDFWTEDDGGHLFSFFWHPLRDTADNQWHPIFQRAVAEIAARLIRDDRSANSGSF